MGFFNNSIASLSLLSGITSPTGQGNILHFRRWTTRGRRRNQSECGTVIIVIVVRRMNSSKMHKPVVWLTNVVNFVFVGFNRRSNHREGLVLRPRPESRERIFVYMQGWLDPSVDVSRICGPKRIGNLIERVSYSFIRDGHIVTAFVGYFRNKNYIIMCIFICCVFIQAVRSSCPVVTL